MDPGRGRLSSRVGGRDIRKPLDTTYLVEPGRDLRGPDRWAEVFGREGRLTVEIGFGKDEFLLELAEARPEGAYLGVEFSNPRVRSYMNKIRRRGLTNVRVVKDHAANVITHALPTSGVAELFVLFPDPWPKDRHAANRLVRPWFAREAHRLLVPGGRITLATDDVPYRDQILSVMEGHGGFTNLFGPGRWGARPDGFGETIFERRWARIGRAAHYMQFRREANR